MRLNKLILFFLMALPLIGLSQVGIGTKEPDGSAMLEIKSSNKGLLIPRMSQTQRNSIKNPANSLMIYQTDNNPGFYYFSSGSWTRISAGNSLPVGSSIGDMLYWNGSSWVKLPAGQNSQPLVFCNGQPTWGGCKATITTAPVSNINAFSANCGGQISDDGGTSVTERGLVWDKTPNVTVNATGKLSIGMGTGEFSGTISGLEKLTTYFIRSYAINKAGISYGNEISFTTSDADISSGLVAYYPFNGNANDESGNGNHGIITDATLTADRLNVNQSAYEFNGTSSVIRVGRNILLEPDQEISISCWIYPNYLPNEQSDAPSSATQIIRKGSGFNYGYHLSWSNLSNNKLESHYYSPTENIVIGQDNSALRGGWHHIVTTYSKANGIVKIYFDGIMVNSQATSNALTHSGDLYIGGFENFQFFKGKIDEVRIYNRPLSEEAITYLASH